jgi:TetR/AcrR family transcriptional regulator, ethionamide resistance regulator
VAAPTISRRGQRAATRRQGDRREQAIIEATRALLADVPFSDLTIAQIAAAAGVSRSSFYFYFADKAQILLLLYGDVLEEMSAELERWFTDPAKHAKPWSHASIDAAVTVALRNTNVVCAALDSRGADREIDRTWSTYFDRAVERCTLLIERERAAGLASSTGPSAHALARALMHMTLHSIHELLRAGASAADAEELIDTLTILWARGVGNEPA